MTKVHYGSIAGDLADETTYLERHAAEPRGDERFYCTDPGEDPCTDPACPVHADGDDPDWGDEAPDDRGDGRDWPCCEHCDHDPGLCHAGECITCRYDLPDYDRQ